MRQQDPGISSPAAGQLLVGDAGLLVVRSLLEAGVDSIVSPLEDAQLPAAAILRGIREDLAATHAVAVRRLPHPHVLGPVLAGGEDHHLHGIIVSDSHPDPAGVVAAAAPHPSVVVLPSGALPADHAAIVVEPAPTPHGLRACIDVAASSARRHGVAIVVAVPESLARGWMSFRTSAIPDRYERAARTARARGGAGAVTGALTLPLHRERAGVDHVVVSSTRHEPALERVVAAHPIGSVLVPAPAAIDAGELAAAIGSARHLLVVGPAGSRLHQAVVDATAADDVGIHCCPEPSSEDDLAREIAAWAGSRIDVPARRQRRHGELPTRIRSALAPGNRPDPLPAIPVVVRAALVLAQGSIGMPACIDAQRGCWQTGEGLVIEHMDTMQLREHLDALRARAEDDPDADAPDEPGRLLIVSAGHPDAATSAAEGAEEHVTVQYASTAQPRVLAAAIATAVRAGRLARDHVILVVPAAGRSTHGRTAGIEPGLLAADIPAAMAAGGVSSNPLGTAELTPAVVEVEATVRRPRAPRGPSAAARYAAADGLAGGIG